MTEEDKKMIEESIFKNKICNQNPNVIINRFKDDLKIHFKYLRYGLFVDENLDTINGLRVIAFDIFNETLDEYIKDNKN